MRIYEVLDSFNDVRNNGDDCEFNGYLEDYLATNPELEPSLDEAFKKIVEKEPGVKICVNLKSDISRDAISNQIIRYKDIFKLEGKALNYPFILYTRKEDEDRALLLLPYSKGSYILAKGCYYCMTEPGGLFIENKNEIVAFSSDDPNRIVEVFDSLYSEKAGALQRTLDKEIFTNYDELKSVVLDAARSQKQDAKALLVELEDRTAKIYQYIVNWFLMKKVLYVQYMVNKTLLNTVHDGNVKRQRNQARLNADEVEILSFSEMWRLQKEDSGQEIIEESSEGE